MPSHIVTLAQLIDNGPNTVRALIAQGDPHRALAMATWLDACGHPDARALRDEAWRAVRTAPRLRE